MLVSARRFKDLDAVPDEPHDRRRGAGGGHAAACCRHRNCKPKRPDPGTRTMQRRNGSLLYSASDLVSHLECEHATTLALQDLDDRLPRAEDDAAAELIKDKGMEHEKAVLAAFKAQGLRVAEIPEQGDPAALMDAALAAMRDGADVIYQGTLVAAPLLRPHGLPAAGGAAVEPRRSQLRGRRHQARAQRQGQVRGPACVLFRPSRGRAGAAAARHAPDAGRRQAGHVSRRGVRALRGGCAGAIPGIRERALRTRRIRSAAPRAARALGATSAPTDGSRTIT